MAAISLEKLNTFGLKATANELVTVTTIAQLEQLLPCKTPYLLLGGGSNMLFSQHYHGCVLHNQLTGINYWEDELHHYFQVAGGENWHQLVKHTVELGVGGLENLALIPGTVGAAPVQNIGAYGVELANVCEQVVAYDIDTGQRHIFNNQQCQFAYRQSFFKDHRHFFISEVTIKLPKQWQPQLQYGELLHWSQGLIATPTPMAIMNQVIAIRSRKLPDPVILPNVGSFFKNPIVTKQQALILKNKYVDMPQYPTPDGVKLAAGWLIEQLNFKGVTIGGAGVHEHQALVLVNNGNAQASEVIALAARIIDASNSVFGVQLEPEVNIISDMGYCRLSTLLSKDTYV